MRDVRNKEPGRDDAVVEKQAIADAVKRKRKLKVGDLARRLPWLGWNKI